MHARFLVGSLVLSCLLRFQSLTVSAAEAQAETLRQSYPVSSGGKLVIRADRGSLYLTGGKTSQAQIEVIRRVNRGSGARAAELIASHQVRFSQEGDTVRVDSKVPGSNLWNWLGPTLEIEIRVSIPREFSVDAETAGGSVRASELEGELGLRTSGGSMQLEALGGSVKAKTAGGSVRATRVRGTVDLATSGGSITVEEATGTSLKVHTSGGSLRLSGIAVPLDARTSGGSIHLESTAGPVDASTSGGSISALFVSAPKTDTSLRTSGGSITVTLPADAAFDLDASTSAGSVRSEFTIPSAGGTPREDRSSLRGPVHGGGPELKLRTSAGGIRVRKG